MKTLNLVMFFIVITSLTACKKQHTVTIQAQNLTNISDGSHYAGMNYVILERGYMFNHKSKQIAYGQLDANGKAVIDVKLKKSLDYVLGIASPSNVCYTEVELEYPINYNEDNNITFKYSTCSVLKFLAKNINCEGVDDKMQFKFYYTDNPDIYIYMGFGTIDDWGDLTFLEGCYDNTNASVGNFFEIPSGNYTMEWVVYRPSDTTTGTDCFTVTEGDTTTYLLEY